MKTHLRITLKKSAIRRPEKQRRILRSLGLRKLHHSKIHKNVPSIRGMAAKVLHLVKVEEIDHNL